MNDIDVQRLVGILEEIRDNQRLQIERQAEALSLQREQFAFIQKQNERTDRLQARAEAIQEKSAQLVAGSRKVVTIIIPIVIALIIYVSWLLFFL